MNAIKIEGLTKRYRDVTAVLDSSPEERARLGAYARETVFRHYSMDTMSDDAIKLYISVVKRSFVNSVEISELDDIEKYLKYYFAPVGDNNADGLVTSADAKRSEFSTGTPWSKKVCQRNVVGVFSSTCFSRLR